MAKISSRGGRQLCSVNAKGSCSSIFAGEQINLDERFVLRSDGAILVRRYQGGSYSIETKLPKDMLEMLISAGRELNFLRSFVEKRGMVVYKTEGRK